MSSVIPRSLGSPVLPLLPVSRAHLFAGYGLAFLVLVLDQATKYAVHDFTPYGWSQAVTGFFNLVHVWNFGAAFSFLADAGGWQRFFFGGVALIVSTWLVFELRKPLAATERAAHAVLLGGALGNGVDRAVRGYVVDFLDVHVQGWHWPAFNIADIGIVGGAGLLIWCAFLNRHPEAAA